MTATVRNRSVRSLPWPGRFLVAILLMLFAGPLVAATIEVRPDRNPVRLDETFQLIFGAEESPDDEPDFGPLRKDFEILAQSQGSQVSIVNGRVSRKTEWTLTVAAKRAGTLTVPAIAFGRDRSEPVTVTVEETPAVGDPSGTPSPGEDVMLEVEAAPRNPYVQAQVLYTVRVLLRVDLAGADLGEPNPSDTLVQKLGEDRRYITHRGGEQYTVIERKYALFPQKSGTVRIEPLHLEARIADGGRSRFNGFFNRPTRIARFESEAVELTVRPVPSAFSGRPWLPAEDVTLEEHWSQDPTRLKAGEPATRTLTLKAKGATVGVLPEMGEAPGDPALKHYADRPSLSEDKTHAGVNATRQEKIALIPGKPGQYQLPAIEIPWWNTRTDRPEVARLPERTVSAAIGETESTPALRPTPAPTLSEPSSESPSMPPMPPVASFDGIESNPWFWMTLLCAGGWLTTAWLWWKGPTKGPFAIGIGHRSRQSLAGGEAMVNAHPQPSERVARKALEKACAANDPAQARRALLDWLRAVWPERPPSEALAAFAGLNAVHRAAIESLERTLYGHQPTGWNGQLLWKLCAALTLEDHHSHKQHPDGLAPLYKIGG